MNSCEKFCYKCNRFVITIVLNNKYYWPKHQQFSLGNVTKESLPPKDPLPPDGEKKIEKNESKIDETKIVEPMIEKKPEQTYRIVMGSELEDDEIPEIIKQIHALDRMYDNIGDVYPMEVSINRLKSNPIISYVVIENVSNKVIAYLDIVPINEESYKKILSGDFDEAEIEEVPLAYMEMIDCYLHFESVLIDKEYRNQRIIGELVAKVVEKYIELANGGCFFIAMVADAWTEGGKILCKGLNMKPVKKADHGYGKDGSLIHNVFLLPTDFNEIRYEKLYKIYHKHYKEHEEYYQQKKAEIQKYIDEEILLVK